MEKPAANADQPQPEQKQPAVDPTSEDEKQELEKKEKKKKKKEKKEKKEKKDKKEKKSKKDKKEKSLESLVITGSIKGTWLEEEQKFKAALKASGLHEAMSSVLVEVMVQRPLPPEALSFVARRIRELGGVETKQ